jgi:CubicO group peptidase (beta-lactamase class C family)
LRKWKHIALASGALAALALLALLGACWLRPPDLIRIGANYTAKIVCSNVFLAARDSGEVLRDDVQAPGAKLLRLMRVSVDRDRGVVRAGLLGFIGDGLAVARPGAGCVAVPDGNLARVAHYRTAQPLADAVSSVDGADAAGAAGTPALSSDLLWPEGEAVRTDAALDRLIADDRLTGPATRAVLVVHRGRLVAERYGAGFDVRTPQLGWSMTKSVTAGLIGVLVNAGRITLDRRGLWPAGDGRENIRVADLLAMSSGLRFDESYGAVSDVTRMLFLEPDMAGFARKQPLDHPVGTRWSYSSGTAVILARLAQDAAGAAGLRLARELLFEPLGMRSAVIEADARGTLVGSSYMYATPRDWARYGQLLLQEGVWRGRQLLPPGYVAMMATPVAASLGRYGQGQVWLWGSDAVTPGKNPDAAFDIPADTFWMEGHDNQFVAVVPSRDLVIVRLGLTPSRTHYRPQPLVRALLQVLP